MNGAVNLIRETLGIKTSDKNLVKKEAASRVETGFII